jgi:1,4-alpha-glucan branching enzyme
VRDLNSLYRATPPLHEVDFQPEGFEWIDWQDRDNSVFSWLRRDRNGRFVVCVANFTPVVRYDYRIGVPAPGRYREIVNTDSEMYGGSNTGNFGSLEATDVHSHERPYSLQLTLPPLSTLVLEPEARQEAR